MLKKSRRIHNHKLPPSREKDVSFTTMIQISTAYILHLVNPGLQTSLGLAEAREAPAVQARENHADIFSGYSWHSQANVFLISRFKQQ